jgi:arylformamidase
LDALRTAGPRHLSQGVCISGTYDLEPIILSARGSYIHLEGDEEHDLSPIRHVQNSATPTMVAYCDGDTGEFQRHSKEFAAALDRHRLLLDRIVVSGLNHFEIVEAFADERAPLHAAVLAHIAPQA